MKLKQPSNPYHGIQASAARPHYYRRAFERMDGSNLKIEDFNLEYPLGNGSNGFVYQARFRPVNEPHHPRWNDIAALKIVPSSPFSNEFSIQRWLDHKNVVSTLNNTRILFRLPESDCLLECIVMEKYSNDLVTWMDQHRDDPTRWNAKKFEAFTRDMLRGVEYLHTCGIIHRDLKPANIFVDDNDRLLISDYGHSLPAGAPVVINSGAPANRAPEVLELHREGPLSAKHAPAMDLWSAGCVLAYLALNKNSFRSFWCHKDGPPSLSAPGPKSPEPETEGEVPRSCSYPRPINPEGQWNRDWAVTFNLLNVFNERYDIDIKRATKSFVGADEKSLAIIQKCLTLDPLRRPTARQLLVEYYPHCH